MWLVIDTNQSRRVPETLRRGRITGRAKGLTLPPYLMAEVLKRGERPRADTLARFGAHTVRLGVEPWLALETVAQLKANQIPSFIPFPAPGDEIERVYRTLLAQSGPAVGAGQAKWAAAVTKNHQDFMAGFAQRTQRARRELARRNVEEVDDWDEALKMARGPDSFIGSLVITTLTNGGERSVVEKNPAALYRAVMKNPFLRHFYHAILYYIVSVTRVWKDGRLHRPHHKNDWTDLTMALYVGHRDALVTEDELLRAVFKTIDPAVRVVSAADL
jgi:hypothetical protein